MERNLLMNRDENDKYYVFHIFFEDVFFSKCVERCLDFS